MKNSTYLEKILDFHNGSLFLIAIAPSYGISQLFNLIFEGVEQKDLIMPLVVVALGIFAFFVLYLVDFILGINASRKKEIKKVNLIYVAVVLMAYIKTMRGLVAQNQEGGDKIKHKD